jgi:2-isopropylmalate synthase
MKKERVMILDTTLRDGEQAPGFSMDVQGKILMARELAKLKVDVIEAGFPASSNEDFEAVSLIAEEIKGITIAGLCRADPGDIDRCFEAIKKASKPRIHTFIATSDLHIEIKLNSTRKKVLKMIKSSVSYASKLCPEVEFSAEDATRSDCDYLAEAIEIAILAGAKIINIPDTVGYVIPREYARLISFLYKKVPALRSVILSTHCHDDFGLAVANSLTALENGARQVECAINGIGERAGNCSLEEIIMAIKTRGETLGLETGIRAEGLYPASKLLTLITGVGIQPNKAIVGANAFAHEAGIHQAGVLKNPLTYEIMKPESVGWPSNTIFIGRHSGRAAVLKKISAFGYTPNEEQLDKIVERIKNLADKKEILDADIEAIVAEEILKIPTCFEFIQANIICGNAGVPTASVDIKINGAIHRAADFGDGPVDAVFKAIKKITGHEAVVLKRFSLDAITGGTDAQARVHIILEEGGRLISSFGIYADIVVAAARAFVSGLNKLEQIAIADGKKLKKNRT